MGEYQTSEPLSRMGEVSKVMIMWGRDIEAGNHMSGSLSTSLVTFTQTAFTWTPAAHMFLTDAGNPDLNITLPKGNTLSKLLKPSPPPKNRVARHRHVPGWTRTIDLQISVRCTSLAQNEEATAPHGLLLFSVSCIEDKVLGSAC